VNHQQEGNNMSISFTTIVKDPEGIHARPAGQIVKEAQRFSSDITVTAAGSDADAKRIFAVMGLGVKTGDTLTVRVSGDDEEQAAKEFESFLRETL
jgi:phosphocarrier protein HPr